MGIIEEIDLVSAYKDLLNGRPVKNSDKFIMKYDGKEYCKKIFIK